MTVNTTQCRSGGVYPHLLFDIQAFELGRLPPCITPPVRTIHENKWQTDETNRMYFNNLIGRLTYGKELLNFRKTGDFYKTNRSQLRRVGSPPLTTRKNKRQPDETNRGTLATESARGNRPAYEKESSNSWETSHSCKTNHPGFPHALPPYDPNNSIFCIYARLGKGKLLSNTQFPPALRNVPCLFKA